jgi:methylenetetrahydrofolate--tRNA-(uracil-5-)-methyltransferase
MIGSLMNHISEAPARTFQPMNSNFGILPPLEEPHKKKDRKTMQLEKAAQGLVELVEKVSF